MQNFLKIIILKQFDVTEPIIIETFIYSFQGPVLQS